MHIIDLLLELSTSFLDDQSIAQPFFISLNYNPNSSAVGLSFAEPLL